MQPFFDRKKHNQLEKGQKIDGVNSIFPLEYLAHKNFMYYYCIGLIHKIDEKYFDAQKYVFGMNRKKRSSTKILARNVHSNILNSLRIYFRYYL